MKQLESTYTHIPECWLFGLFDSHLQLYWQPEFWHDIFSLDLKCKSYIFSHVAKTDIAITAQSILFQMTDILTDHSQKTNRTVNQTIRHMQDHTKMECIYH